MALGLLATVVAMLVLLLPAIAVVAALDRRSSWPTIVSLGSALGLAVAALGGYHALRSGLPFDAFRSLLALEWMAGAVAFAEMRGRMRRGELPERETAEGGWWLAGLLALVFASRAVPLFFGDLPLGTDPSFHALLAKKILLSGAIPTDWQPFEPVALNYPVGPHLLVAEISRVTGVAIPVVFKSLFPIVAALTTLAVTSVTLRLLGREARLEASLAGLAFAFLAQWGSVDVYRWGGLPNAMGVLLLPALVELVFHDSRRVGIALFGALFAALVVVHHHAALCAGALFAGYVAFTMVVARRLTPTAVRIASGLALATLLAALPLATYLRGGGEVGRTSVLRFYEPLVTLWGGLGNIGWPLVALGIGGAALALRGAIEERRLFLAWWVTLLFAAFVVFAQAWRFAALARDGGFYAAFTPSRFLTNMVQPLAVLAGVALAWLAMRVRDGLPRRAILAGLVAGSVLFAVPALREQCVDVPVNVEALEWIDANTKPDALVVAESPWASYFTWRETTFTPLPASEARADERVVHKREVLGRDPQALRDFARTTGRTVYIVVGTERRLDGLKEVHVDDRSRVYELR